MESPRALSLVDALESGLQIESAAWRSVVALHVGWAAPMSVLHVLVAASVGRDVSELLDRLDGTRGLEVDLLVYVSAAAVVTMVQELLATVLRAALARSFAPPLLGRALPTTKDVVAWLRLHAVGALGMAVRLQIVLSAAFMGVILSIGLGSLIVGLVSATGSTVLILLGASLALVVAGVGGFLALAWGVRACLAPIVFAVEGGEASAALERSRVLLSGRAAWSVFWVLLLSLVVAAALNQGLTLLAGSGVAASALGTVSFLFLWMPFQAYFSRVLTLLYFDRRVRGEGFEGPGTEQPGSAASA